jgi:hypothetical protein
MKTPTNCPFCNGPLINEYEQRFINKYCSKYIDHNILIRPWTTDTNQVDFISIDYGFKDKVADRIIWYFTGQILLCRVNGKDYELPWFEPDLSNYSKLVNKIKLYTIFQ